MNSIQVEQLAGIVWGLSTAIELMARNLDKANMLPLAIYCKSIRDTINDAAPQQQATPGYLVLRQLLAKLEHEDPPPFPLHVIPGGKND